VHLPCGSESFDVVLLLDVLEHVDDVSALREASRVLSPGGFLFLSVPAFPRLWSYRDEDAGHRRRYTRTSLEQTVRGAHLEIREIGYYQCLLFPLVVASRVLGRRGPAAREAEDLPFVGLNALCALVNRFEVALGAVVRWPWGSSLVAVCQKG
jgi:SAM-dependent methyltransferase